MSSFIVNLDGVEVATHGLKPTVLNISLSGPDQTGLRVAQIVIGVLCLMFCWIDLYTYVGIWTGIPFILTGSFFIVSEIKAHPGLLCAALTMNVLSIILAFTAIVLYSVCWTPWGSANVLLFADTFGLYCSVHTMLNQRCRFPSQKVFQDAKPLLGS